MNQFVFDEPTRLSLKDYLAQGSVDPLNKFSGMDSFLLSLFFSERPFYTIICRSVQQMREIASGSMIHRGIRPVIYEDLVLDEEKDDINPNERAFFLAAQDQPHNPYILLTTTTDYRLYIYLRKFGMTILSFVEEVPYYDYFVDFDFDLHEILCRSIFVQPPGDIYFDLRINYNSQSLDNYANDLRLKLEEKLKFKVDLKIYSESVHRKQELGNYTPTLELYTPVLDSNVYVLDLLEVQFLLDFDFNSNTFNKPMKINYPRKFIVAPSGSGKSSYIRISHDTSLIDLDNIFEFPKIKDWWLNAEIAAKTNLDNQRRLQNWLKQADDGQIGFYADDLGLIPDAVVLINFELHLYNFEQRKLNNPGQGIFDQEKLKNERSKLIEKYDQKIIFDTFQDAISYVTAQGRVTMPRRNRYTFEYCYIVKREALPEWKIQSAYSSQTWKVKSITYAVSKFLSLSAKDTETPRRLAMLKLGYPITNRKWLTGYVKYKNKVIPLTVSGHLTNYCILLSYIPLDITRILDHVGWNMQLYSTRRKLTEEEIRLGKLGLLAERTNLGNIYSLWHNIPEWIIAIASGYIWLKYLGLSFNLDLLNSIILRIESFDTLGTKVYDVGMRVKYKLDEGFLVQEDLDKSAIGRVRNWSSFRLA